MLTGLALVIRNVPELSDIDSLVSMREDLEHQRVGSDKATADSQQQQERRGGVNKATEQKRRIDEFSVSQLNIEIFERQLDGVTCIRHDPHVLFFNRIPKCASTSIGTLLFVNSERLKMRFLEDSDGAHNWRQEDRTSVEDTIISQFSVKEPSMGVIYVRHFYFSDFPNLREKRIPYIYVNMIRNPVERFISSFVYYHYSDREHIQRLRQSQGTDPDEGIEECLRRQTSGCETNILTHYFCGSDAFCASGSQVALNRALVNLVKSFAAVGIMEDMDRSLQLFAHLLPRYFRQAAQMPKAVTEKNVNVKGQGVRRSLERNEEIKEKIRVANAADIILYNFAKRLFRRRMEVCGLDVG